MKLANELNQVEIESVIRPGKSSGGSDKKDIKDEAVKPTPDAESENPQRVPAVSPEGQLLTETAIDAAREYINQGRVPIPLSRADVKDQKRAGKAPILKQADYPPLAECDEVYLRQWWGGDKPQNLGVLLEPPHVVIDLDSKADTGASVCQWLESHPALASWPRERTRGGAHLHVRCEDIPDAIKTEGGKRHVICRELNDDVDAEVFFGGVITVSPSVHREGQVYHWEKRGEPPTLSWEELCRALGISPEPTAKATTPERHGFKGDIGSLDIVALCEELGIYGQCLDEAEGKHAVKCPWHDSHSDSDEGWKRDDASTVVWEARTGRWPSFCCLHASHGKKTLTDFLEWAESQSRGIVDRHCAREWMGNRLRLHGDKPFIALPRENHLVSDFAAEIGEVMKPKHEWFVKGDQVVAVSLMRETVKPKSDKTEDDSEPQKKPIRRMDSLCPGGKARCGLCGGEPPDTGYLQDRGRRREKDAGVRAEEYERAHRPDLAGVRPVEVAPAPP